MKGKIWKFNLWQKIKEAGIAKSLLLSVMGTTISIILTFGTSRYFDHRKKLANGRQLAIMAIHDIDNTVKVFEEYADNEYQLSLQAQYLQEHLDSLENIGFDTLSAVFDYLLADNFIGEGYILDDANEKVFLSSQDAWKNIDNATFIDRVQTFYNERHEFYNYLSTSLEWCQPLEEREFIKRKINTPDYGFDIVGYLKELLRRDDVCYYIAYSSLRQQLFNSTSQKWRNVSDECQFLMGISDREMEEYIKSRERKGNPPSERQLLGRWHAKDKGNRDEKREQILEFCKDHTAAFTTISYESSHLYIGNIVIRSIARGSWDLQGDSVLVTLKPEQEFAIDTTAISYRAELKPDILKLMEEWKGAIKKGLEESRKKGEGTIKYRTFIDQSETKLKWSKVMQKPDGTEEVVTQYFTKVFEQDELP